MSIKICKEYEAYMAEEVPRENDAQLEAKGILLAKGNDEPRKALNIGRFVSYVIMTS